MGAALRTRSTAAYRSLFSSCSIKYLAVSVEPAIAITDFSIGATTADDVAQVSAVLAALVLLWVKFLTSPSAIAGLYNCDFTQVPRLLLSSPLLSNDCSNANGYLHKRPLQH